MATINMILLVLSISFYHCSNHFSPPRRLVLLGAIVGKRSCEYSESQKHSNGRDCNDYKRSYFASDLFYSWRNKEGKIILDGPCPRMFNTFEEKIGVHLIRVKPTPVTIGISTNGTYSGEIGLVQSAAVDVAGNVMYYTHDKYQFADFTVPVLASPICIVVRRAPAVPFTEVLLFPYTPLTWATILISLSAAILARYYFTAGGAPRGGRWSALTHAALDVVQVISSGDVSRTGASLPERVLLGTLLLFSLVLSNAYTGQLLGFLTAPPRVADLQTLEDVARVLDDVFSYTLLPDIYDNPNSPQALRYIRWKLKKVEDRDALSVIGRVSCEDTIGTQLPTILYSYVSSLKELTHNGERMLHRVPECVNPPGHLAFMLRKNSPLFPAFSDVVMRVVEAGLVEHWVRMQRHHMAADGTVVAEGPSGKTAAPRSLRVKQMAGAVSVLVVGTAIAAGAFLVEVFLGKVFKGSDKDLQRWEMRRIRPSTLEI